jgi:hypothetical protein
MTSKRIYFAGKVGFGGWREDIFGHGVGACYHEEELLDPQRTWEVGGGVIYGGPFVTGDKHGCYVKIEDFCRTSGHRPITRADIFRVNCARIQRADWVFAYIDSFTAYGTFFEIGFAAAHAIPVAVALSPDLNRHGNPDDLWHVLAGAKHVYRYGESAGEMFEDCCRELGLTWQAKRAAAP